MRPESRQHGFGLVAAMFVIIIITAVITAMARLAETQNATNSMAIQQARAYQAARAGLEWGIYQAITMAPSSCEPNASFSAAGFDGFPITVKCEEVDAGLITEENKAVTFYRITATAEYGNAGSPDYAYRQLTAMVER